MANKVMLIASKFKTKTFLLLRRSQHRKKARSHLPQLYSGIQKVDLFKLLPVVTSINISGLGILDL